MGFLNKLKTFLPKVSLATEYHHAPSERFKTQVDLMTHIIERVAPEGWASFEADQDGKSTLIQVTGDCINGCKEVIDVPAIAGKIGLTSLAETIVPTDSDRTVHLLPDALPQEFAEVVHGIFLHHFGLRPDYRVEGWLEG